VAAPQSGESGQHLGEMIQRTARVIEALLGNTECGQLFVQRGGVASMLLLYELPRLVPSFGSHSPLHAVTSALRILAQHHAKQLAKLLAAALDSRLKVMDVEARVPPSPFTANEKEGGHFRQGNNVAMEDQIAFPIRLGDNIAMEDQIAFPLST